MRNGGLTKTDLRETWNENVEKLGIQHQLLVLTRHIFAVAGVLLRCISSPALSLTCPIHVLQPVRHAGYHDQLRVHGDQQRDPVHRVSTAS